MSRCKESIIELIDQALECKRLLCFYGCRDPVSRVLECEGCQIKRALRAARSCIIKGGIEVDLLNIKLIGVQDAIEDKLQAFLGDGELSEEKGDPDD